MRIRFRIRYPLLTFFCLTIVMNTVARPVYFGTYDKSIQIAEFEPTTGRLRDQQAAASLPLASFLEKSADGRHLYAVSENTTGSVHAFSIGANGALTALGSVASGGGAPCHLALSPAGDQLAVANYSGGSVIIFATNPDGSLGARVAFFEHSLAVKINSQRQEKPHAHGVTWSPDGHLLLVPDLGADRVYIYARDARTGNFGPHSAQAWLELPPGSGPRHATFSPDARYLYIVNELTSSISVASYSPRDRTFALRQTTTTLPADFTLPNTTAEIAIHPAGHTVYVSNRGHDSLAVFSRNADTGELTPAGHVSVPENPRHFTLDPDGHWLLAAGQNDDRVQVFSVDATNGKLTPASELNISKPVCVKF